MSRVAIMSVLSVLFCGCAVRYGGTTPGLSETRIYYVDSIGGNDSNSGLSADMAWATLDAVNSKTFSAGDRILFKSGTSYSGCLIPSGSGTENDPIIIDRYGEGPMPCINGGDTDMEALLLYNVECWEIGNLEITNPNPQQPGLAGVRVQLVNFGRARHIYLRNLYVHNVNGPHTNRLPDTGYGIYWHHEGDTVPSFFDDLRIENCHIQNVNCRGIQGQSRYPRSNWHPSTNVVIRGNLVEQIGGAGITTIGTDGCLIEKNRVNGVGLVSQGNGIHPYKSDNTVIQYNEVSDCRRGTTEGWGFNSDGNCRNSLFQYNYSHDNEGGYHLIIGPATGGWTVGCEGTVIRYNISVNDGFKVPGFSPTFNISGNVNNTHIYNNTIYVGTRKQPIELFRFHDAGLGVWPNATTVNNNIFYVAGSTYSIWGGSTSNEFSHNIWYGEIQDRPEDLYGTDANPKLIDPGSSTTEDYKVHSGSAAIAGGVLIAHNGGADYFGNSVSPSSPPTIGAHEYQFDPITDSDKDKMTDLWETEYGLNPDDPADAFGHADSDGMNNLLEFAMGGNPADSNDTGYAISWSRRSADRMFYVYPRRIQSDLIYRLEESTDLSSNLWTESACDELPAPSIINTDFESVTNEVPITEQRKFVRLRIE